MGSNAWLLASSLLAWHLLHRPVEGHGYLASPRSRNLLAFEETVWWPQTADDPEPETCPHCLNRGGTLARCGLFGDPRGGVRNYDAPKNSLGGPMPPKIQATYSQGQDVTLDVTLTAHHKGHFVFSACPIAPGEVPTQECFDQHQLTFVEDLLHGANFDPNYPERAYLAPVNDPNYFPDLGSTRGVMNFSFKMRLPSNLYGDLVLIQWYYLTANSCYHEGYHQYNWPAGWGGGTSSMPCTGVSDDGTGAPEQFWNCAEVKILRDDTQANLFAPNPVPIPPSPTSQFVIPAPTPANRPTPAEISSGIAIPVGLPSQSTNNGNPPSSAGSHGKTIVGYYASWQWYDRNKKAAPENMDFTKVQRVNFAFFQINEQGDMWGTDSWGDPNLLFGPYNWNPGEGSKKYCSWDSANMKNCNNHHYEKGLIHLVHAAGAEIYPSLGGWTLSDPFPAMAASAPARAKFAENCVDLIKEYGFDGIDIDWEYPGFPDHSGTPQDRDNFKLLLNDVRAKLDELGAQTGRFYGLTAALPCGPRHIANMDIAHVASTLSELNLMTYDFHGAFSPTAGINAPLYYQGWGDEDFNVHSCVQNWLAGGGSRDKINIGLPFYGRSYDGPTGLNQPHKGADQGVWGIDDGTPQYFNIVAQLPFMTSVWDKQTWTPYAYFDNGGLVSYDDENAICAKVQYAQEHNLGGFIIWELSGDVMDDLSTPLLDVTNKKLLNPDFDCGEPGFYPQEEVTILPPQPTGQVTQTNPSGFSPTSGTFPTPSMAIPPTPAAPVGVFPTINEPVNDQNDFIECGATLGSFNAEESKPLDLSFRYELHRNVGVSVSDATNEFRSSLLNSVASRLQCPGAISIGRLLRNSPLEASREHVMAIQSGGTDVSGSDTPCSIQANLQGTICHSAIEPLTIHIERGTSVAVAKVIAEDILFFVRTSMAAGSYESNRVRKVIYVERISADPSEANETPPNGNVVWQPQNEGGSSSSVVAIVLGLIVAILVCVLLFVFMRRKRRGEKSRVTEPQSIETDEPVTSEATTAPASATEPTVEEILAKAVDTEETWRKALDTYQGKSASLSISTGESAPDPNGWKPSEEEPQDQTMQDLESGDKGPTNPSLSDNNNQRMDPDETTDQVEPVGDIDPDGDEANVSNPNEKVDDDVNAAAESTGAEEHNEFDIIDEEQQHQPLPSDDEEKVNSSITDEVDENDEDKSPTDAADEHGSDNEKDDNEASSSTGTNGPEQGSPKETLDITGETQDDKAHLSGDDYQRKTTADFDLD